MNLKTVRLTRFQKPQLQSVSVFFKFVHLWLHLYSLCHLYLTLTFWAVSTQFGGSFRCLNFDKAIQQQQLLWGSEYMKIIYENCGVKSYMKEDHRSCRRNFCSCEKKAWKKKFRLLRDSNPWPLRYRCSALPFELTSLACCCFRLSDGSWYVAYSFYPRLWFCYDLGLEWTRNLWHWGWN